MELPPYYCFTFYKQNYLNKVTFFQKTSYHTEFHYFKLSGANVDSTPQMCAPS